MVSGLSLAGMFFTLIVSLILPVVLAIVFGRRNKTGAVPFLVGAGVFILFVLILEALVHQIVFALWPSLSDNIWLYMLYGGLMAGIFEEVGRFIAFSFFLKKKRLWQHGVAYGIGHGGIEAVLIVGVVFINNIIYSLMINSGSFDTLIAAVGSQGTVLQQAQQALINTDPALFFAGGIERIWTICIQIALSLLVLMAVRSGKKLWLALAIFIHAVIDFGAVLGQKEVLSIWIVELWVMFWGVIALVFIIKSRKSFSRWCGDQLEEQRQEAMSEASILVKAAEVESATVEEACADSGEDSSLSEPEITAQSDSREDFKQNKIPDCEPLDKDNSQE